MESTADVVLTRVGIAVDVGILRVRCIVIGQGVRVDIRLETIVFVTNSYRDGTAEGGETPRTESVAEGSYK